MSCFYYNPKKKINVNLQKYFMSVCSLNLDEIGYLSFKRKITISHKLMLGRACGPWILPEKIKNVITEDDELTAQAINCIKVFF